MSHYRHRRLYGRHHPHPFGGEYERERDWEGRAPLRIMVMGHFSDAISTFEVDMNNPDWVGHLIESSIEPHIEQELTEKLTSPVGAQEYSGLRDKISYKLCDAFDSNRFIEVNSPIKYPTADIQNTIWKVTRSFAPDSLKEQEAWNTHCAHLGFKMYANPKIGAHVFQNSLAHHPDAGEWLAQWKSGFYEDMSKEISAKLSNFVKLSEWKEFKDELNINEHVLGASAETHAERVMLGTMPVASKSNTLHNIAEPINTRFVHFRNTLRGLPLTAEGEMSEQETLGSIGECIKESVGKWLNDGSAHAIQCVRNVLVDDKNCDNPQDEMAIAERIQHFQASVQIKEIAEALQADLVRHFAADSELQTNIGALFGNAITDAYKKAKRKWAERQRVTKAGRDNSVDEKRAAKEAAKKAKELEKIRKAKKKEKQREERDNIRVEKGEAVTKARAAKAAPVETEAKMPGLIQLRVPSAIGQNTTQTRVQRPMPALIPLKADIAAKQSESAPKRGQLIPLSEYEISCHVSKEKEKKKQEEEEEEEEETMPTAGRHGHISTGIPSARNASHHYERYHGIKGIAKAPVSSYPLPTPTANQKEIVPVRSSISKVIPNLVMVNSKAELAEFTTKHQCTPAFAFIESVKSKASIGTKVGTSATDSVDMFCCPSKSTFLSSTLNLTKVDSACFDKQAGLYAGKLTEADMARLLTPTSSSDLIFKSISNKMTYLASENQVLLGDVTKNVLSVAYYKPEKALYLFTN